MKLLPKLLGVFVAGGFAGVVSAAAADLEEIKSRQLPPAALQAKINAPKDAAERESAKAELAAHFLSVAAEARTFSSQAVSAEKRREAEVLEAKNLLKAELAGDVSQKRRAAQLVAALRKNPEVPEQDRYALAATETRLLLREVVRSKGDLAVAREVAARELIAEFPRHEGGYRQLLSLAAITEEPERIRTASQEILNSPAPFSAKASATILSERQDLLGQSLCQVAESALGETAVFRAARNRLVVLYTWQMGSPRSVEFAKELAASAPKEAFLIGVNIDEEARIPEARSQVLPGVQIYSGGRGSKLSLRLKLTSSGLVYLTNETGRIVDVNAARELLANR